MQEFNENKGINFGLVKLFQTPLILYITKALIATICVIIVIKAITPKLPDLRIPETERNKLILISFIQNPYVLSRLAKLEELKGNKNGAARYLEAAIALVEMNGAPDRVILKYQKELELLRKKDWIYEWIYWII